MKLWLITQDVNNNYDTYDSAVVAAENENEARLINPDGEWGRKYFRSWCNVPEEVNVKYLGQADVNMESGIVLASFNAG